MINRYSKVQMSTKKEVCGLQEIKVYRDEVKTSKRYAFFHVEFRGNECFCLVFCQQSVVRRLCQDTGSGYPVSG